jgi:hypothetical protein
MKAVWSLWNKPLVAKRRQGWLTPKHHLLSWVLSFELASRHYPDTCLITDDAGAEMLIDGLGLPFGSVSLALNALADHDPDWWAIGKLYAYAAQEEAFVHIDNDVFLWEPLPKSLEQASVFAQHPECTPYGASFYRPESLEYDIRRHGGWMPEEFERYMPVGGDLKAENCGVIGGTRTDFIRYYAESAIRFIEHPDNQLAWQDRPKRDQDFIIFEQLMLSACLAYHQGRQGSPYTDVSISYVFDSYEDALTLADGIGYTHLVAESKRDPQLSIYLEQIVARDFPHYYQRCMDFLERQQKQALRVLA